MSNDRTASLADNSYCLGCGYSLRQLTANRCPECGRQFDSTDRRTMSIARPLRGWQRWLLKPLGWPTIVLALLGAGGMGYLSRSAHLTPAPWSILRDEFRWPSPAMRPFTVPDIIFYAAAGCLAAFVVAFSLRLLAKLLVPRNARRANSPGGNVRICRTIIAAAFAISIYSIVFGWRQRIGQRWMARVLAPSLKTSPFGSWPSWESSRFNDPAISDVSPVRLSLEQSRAILTTGVADLPKPSQRLAALGLLVECDGRAALPVILRAAANEHDTVTLAWEIRAASLWRHPATAPLFISLLHDSRPGIRAAAADAIGILRHPSYSIAVLNPFWVWDALALDLNPPAPVGGILSPPNPNSHRRGFIEHDLIDDPPNTVDPSVRVILQQMMLEGATSDEREAAARTLVAWPPERFQLRVAEWGVWIDNKGQMALAQSIIDEIPPFVKGAGNPLADFGSYFPYPSIVTKPIVHLTTNTAIAVDLEVRIREGRPWFAFPEPDDFSIGDEQKKGQIKPLRGSVWGWLFPATAPSPPGEFDNVAVKPLPDCREGYPWLAPHHRPYSSSGTGFGGSPEIYSLGLRWQSLIVSPTRQSWMAPPVVPSDARFQWWPALRDVPSCWVCNRGQTERFLYYDGPTRSPVPVAVELKDAHHLKFVRPTPDRHEPYREQAPKPHFQPMAGDARNDLPEHAGLYIEVRSGVLRGQYLSTIANETVAVESELPLHGNAVIERFRKMLLDYGLTGPEAQGLIGSWAPQFFRTEGRRFILRMSPTDYAEQCPMQVRPTPTTVVRLGLVLTEFDAKPSATAPHRNSKQ